MEIAKAQKDVRTVYLGGFAGQLVSSLLWAASAALGTWGSPRSGIVLLVVGGFFIFPATQLLLRLMGRPCALTKSHPLNFLAMQVAFTLPLVLPVVGAAALHRLNWFYPAFMVVLGAHYLPFTFLYGMRMFAFLALLLVSAGLGIGLYLPEGFSTGAWVTAVILLFFSFLGKALVEKEQSTAENSNSPTR